MLLSDMEFSPHHTGVTGFTELLSVGASFFYCPVTYSLGCEYLRGENFEKYLPFHVNIIGKTKL